MKLSEATILLVDDEPILLEIFTHWLTEAGCRYVYTAKDGEAALAVLDANSIDAIVTDVRMPVMDGITLVRRLAERRGMVPSILFVSGFGDVNEREMHALGVEAFLAKPIARDDYVGALEKAVRERSSLWLTRMSTAPRQSIEIRVKGIGEQTEQNFFQLGRGGFGARCSGPAKFGKLAFRCEFVDEEREITGEGFVRWYSRSDQAVGIEFSFLDASCRSWVLKEIAVNSPRSFIPSLL